MANAGPTSRPKLGIRHISNAVVLSRYDRVESVDAVAKQIGG